MIDQKWHKKLKWAKRIGIKIKSWKPFVDILPGGLFRAQDGRRSKDFRGLYQQTNKQKKGPAQEGTGTWPDYLANRADQKNWLGGALRENNCTEIKK